MHAAELLGARCSRRLLPNLLNRRRNQQYSLLLIQSLSAGGLRHSSFSSHTEQQLKQPCTQDVRAADECGEVLLTRDFIARSLYNRDNGYFSTKDVINHLPGALDFRSMLGEWHYRLAVKQVQYSSIRHLHWKRVHVLGYSTAHVVERMFRDEACTKGDLRPARIHVRDTVLAQSAACCQLYLRSEVRLVLKPRELA